MRRIKASFFSWKYYFGACIIVLTFLSCSKSDTGEVNNPPSNTGQDQNNGGGSENGGGDENNGNNSGGDDSGSSNTTKVGLFQADPTIFEKDGVFYLYGTNDQDPNQGIQVYTSPDLVNWTGPAGYRDGYALSKIENFGEHDFWAPQVWEDQEVFYMAYVAEEHIAISSSGKLTGPFSQVPSRKLFTGSAPQIDPFMFVDDDGEKYLFYVDISNGNKIFVTGLNDDYKSVKDENGKECIEYSQPWEKEGTPIANVNEGPTVLKHDGYYYLLYSANHFQNPNYAVGYATSKNIEGPWVKYEDNPILNKDMVGWSGTGHGDIIFKDDGKPYTDAEGKMYYVFHTHFAKNGSQATPRRTAIIKIHFESNGAGPDKLVVDPDSFYHLQVSQ